jgi:hypothetical protein
MSDERYVVVTATSTFRQRYVIPASELQAMSPDIKLDPKTLVEFANDSVTCEDVKEFSQHWLGEQIVDTFVVDKERILHLFDRDNDYLASWSEDKKLEWIADWESKVNDVPELLKDRPIDFPTDSSLDFPPSFVEQSNLTSQKMNEDPDDSEK